MDQTVLLIQNIVLLISIEYVTSKYYTQGFLKEYMQQFKTLFGYSLCLPLEDNLKLKRLVLHFHPDHLAKIRPSHRLAFDKDSLKILVLAVRVSILLVDL